MDAMSDAIEGADVMLYGVSLQYKESANVRQYNYAMPRLCGICSLLTWSALHMCAYPRGGRHSAD